MLLIFSFYSLSFLTSCKKKCTQDLVGHSILTGGDRSINPYLGSENVKFKTTNGDSFSFTNGLREFGSKTEYEFDAWQAEELGGCRGNYVYNDYDICTFNSQNDSQKIEIYLTNSYIFGVPTEGKQIRFLFDTKEKNITHFLALFNFSNDTLFNTVNKFASIISYHDTIGIGPKTFFKVYELYAFNTDARNIEWYKTAYYSLVEGFVGVRSNLGKLWYLDKKQ